ncbi:MAG: hypothetical protein HRT44_06505 [Bdellovibrionales bacterium]|nr:hypothetical protein [Bdellovibrionales bacterium]NQZ18892.1 hypothetical protein [Bdellovibrionales bacterium]
MLKKLTLLWIISSFSFSIFASEEDLFGEGSNDADSKPGTSFQKIGVNFSGSIDVRASRTGHHKSWDEGGRAVVGDGTKQNGDSSFYFTLPRASLVADITYENESVAFIQFNVDDHANNGTETFTSGLFEAYLKLRPLKNTNYWKDTVYKVGMFVPPVSLEHDQTAWSTEYTVTPSAINTWVGEELKVLGIEEDYEFELSSWHKIRTQFAVFTSNDPMGGTLAWRGWAFHDYQLKAGDRLFFRDPDSGVAPPSDWGFPLKEVDGRPAVYGKLRYSYGDSFLFDVFHYQNFAEESELDSVGDYAWKSRFTNLGMKWNFLPSWTLLSQLLWGESSMGFSQTVNYVAIDFVSWYAMINYQTGKHSFTGRYDDFRVFDTDLVNDDNNQKGWAATAAYRYNCSDFHSISVEYLHAYSLRVGGTPDPLTDAYDDQFLINWRSLF